MQRMDRIMYMLGFDKDFTVLLLMSLSLMSVCRHDGFCQLL